MHLAALFPDEESARKWFEKCHWSESNNKLPALW